MKYLLFTFLFLTSIFAQTLNFSFQDVKHKDINITLNNDGIHFTNSKNKIVLLDFWGVHCPPCIMTIPHLVELKDRYPNQLDIIGIQVQDRLSKTQMRGFMRQFDINYSIIDDDKTSTFTGIISQITNWQGGIPFMLLIDQNGKIKTLYQGMISQNEILEDIQSLIHQQNKK